MTDRPLAVIVPAYNEAGRIERVLEVLRDIPGLGEIVVVVDGSTDATYAEAEAAAALDPRLRCLRLASNQGKGGAMLAGARAVHARWLLFLDADLIGLRPEHVQTLIEPVMADEVDMAVGVFRGGRWNTDLPHYLTPWLSGQRCLRAELLWQVPEPALAGYGVETAITVIARRQQWRCRYVPLRRLSHPPSEFHRGGLRGALNRGRMYAQIFAAWRATAGRSRTKTRLPIGVR